MDWTLGGRQGLTGMWRWLAAWFVGSAAFGVITSAVSLVSTYLSLRRDGATSPARILARLVMAPAMSRRSGHTLGSPQRGITGWLWWDTRWGASGQSRVTVLANDGHTLHLRLSLPVEFRSNGAGRIVTTEVRFIPSSPPDYTWGLPPGRLEPLDTALVAGVAVAAGEPVTARLCLLP